MSKLRCQLCSQEIDDMSAMMSHMSNAHFMNFNDKEDMNRRLVAVGLDPVVDNRQIEPIFVNPTRRVLNG